LSAVEFNFKCEGFTKRDIFRDTKFLNSVANKEGKQIEKLIYHFVGEKEILSINQIHLNHNYLTDIISFDYSFLTRIIGEIFICIPIVKSNSEKYSNGNFNMELKRIILHGLLHLLGYNDGTISEKSVMRFKEDFYLNNLD
jgi:probable rRNA maturation factor